MNKSTTSTTSVAIDPGGGFQVTVGLPGSPLRYVLYLGSVDGGELFCGAVAIEPPEGEIPSVPLTAPIIREFADRFERLEHHARSAAAVFAGDSEKTMPMVRTRRELSPEFLRDVLHRHDEYREQGLAPTQTLAREERVSTGTVKHWLRKARGLEEMS